MSVVPKLECIELHEWKHVTVAAGQKTVIIDYPITGNYVAFIDKIACDLPYEEETTGTIAKMYHEPIIDGVHHPRIKYEIPINRPRQFKPPLVARNRIKWFFYNPDSKIHTVGVLIEGRLCKPASTT